MSMMNDELVQSLHEGMFEQPLWSTFLDRLRSRSSARFTALMFSPIGQEKPVALLAGDSVPAENGALFAEHLVGGLNNYRRMREGRVYTLQELIDPGSSSQIALLQAAARHDRNEIRTVRVSEPGGIEAWLSCGTDPRSGAMVSALLTRLLPHLRIALRTFGTLERERFRSAVTTEAFHRLNFGWMTLDAQCRILDTTPNIEHLFQRTALLRRGRYDRLTPASPALDREIAAYVRACAQEPDVRPKAVNISRDPLIDLLLRQVAGPSLAIPSRPVAIAYVSGDRLSQADRCEQLVDMFGLLPSEARLAWAIVQGLSIMEAAGHLGISVETARNYSKKIYAKTGSRGQAELVRNVLTSVLALT